MTPSPDSSCYKPDFFSDQIPKEARDVDPQIYDMQQLSLDMGIGG